MNSQKVKITLGLISILLVTLSFTAWSTSSAAGSAAKPVHLKFSSHVLGSAWYAYGGIISELIRPVLPPGSTIDVLPYGGGFSGPHLPQFQAG